MCLSFPDIAFYLFWQLHQLRQPDFPKLKILSMNIKMEQCIMFFDYFKIYVHKSDFLLQNV